MIKVLKNERVITCDIDDTLVMHGNDKMNPLWTYAHVQDHLAPDGVFLKLRINEPMVRLVKEELKRGSQLVFWSRGGYQWAYNVVKALGLDSDDKELIILTKPFAYFDDSDVNNWMKDRVYITPDTVYKK